MSRAPAITKLGRVRGGVGSDPATISAGAAGGAALSKVTGVLPAGPRSSSISATVSDSAAARAAGLLWGLRPWVSGSSSARRSAGPKGGIAAAAARKASTSSSRFGRSKVLRRRLGSTTAQSAAGKASGKVSSSERIARCTRSADTRWKGFPRLSKVTTKSARWYTSVSGLAVRPSRRSGASSAIAVGLFKSAEGRGPRFGVVQPQRVTCPLGVMSARDGLSRP